MQMKLYSVQDVKAEFYGNPFSARNAAEATRMFQQLVEDEKTQVNRYPDEFVLWELGAFDVETGELLFGEKKNLGTAADYQTKKDA